uniref:Protein cdv3 log isoform x1 n=1 Tax=Xenopsylla cheopis TaxID=163159 RepID=A0A6M2DLG1_XENCH
MGNLDDFFAKKDRKKSKTTKKFSTADEIAKKMEDSTKKSDTKSKKESEEPQTPARDEDEWKDFEEEKKDYTGLKIGHLLISETEQSQNSNDCDSTYQNNDGESTINNEKKVVGPWKKIGETVPPVVEEKVEKPAAPKPTGGYVPPALRNQATTNRIVSRNKSRAAPDIHNEEFFPTLSSSKNEVSNAWVRKKEGTFEEVKHGNRNVRNDQGASAPLSLGNRFNTLADSS